jgi:hypothetical protein
MKQNPLQEAKNCPAVEDGMSILWNLKVPSKY